MGKKIFRFFLVISILALVFLGGYYYLSQNREMVKEIPILNDVFPMEDVIVGTENVGGNAENPVVVVPQLPEGDDVAVEEATYKSDVLSVHVCDGYSDGSFAIRNIRMDMTFRQVVNIELKNIGVYVSDKDYGKGTFYCMASDDEQGKDLLPVLERAILGNPCEIVYDFSADITIEDPVEVPYLEGVQYQFIEGKENVDAERKIEDAFADCFGKPVTEVENGYYISTFTAPEEVVTMYYEYSEKKKEYNLKYIVWEKIE